MRTQTPFVVSIILALALLGCDDDGAENPMDTTQADSATTPDGTSTPDATSIADSTPADSTTPDQAADVPVDMEADGRADTTVAVDAAVDSASDANDTVDMGDARTPMMEMEPNDGMALAEVNTITTSDRFSGAVSVADDADVLQLDTVAGRVYTATLTTPAGSALVPNLTVIDDGRGGDPPGDDYVKIAVDGANGTATLTFLAMGEMGYYLIVRDDRNVGGAGGEGSPAHTWELTVDEHSDLMPWTGAALSFPTTFQDQLDAPSSLRLYPFTGTQNADIIVGLTASGDLDGRLFIFSEATGDWIARNDDGPSAPDPLIDAFLTANGAMFVVVENIIPTATDLSYSISASTP